jgi:hypothetical protein
VSHVVVHRTTYLPAPASEEIGSSICEQQRIIRDEAIRDAMARVGLP